MAATQQVVIKLTTTGNTRQIKQHRNELIRLAAAGRIANQNGVTLSKTFEKMDKRLNTFKNTAMMAGKWLGTLNRVALKLFTIGFAAGAASLTLINALFATGRVVANLYKTTMQALAAVVAAVGAALAGAAAAMREYTAAVQAYAFKSSPVLNNRLFESRAALRALQDDAVLATFGIQALNQAFANIAKNTQVTAVSKNLLKGLADFATAGGDPAQNLAAAAEFVGLLQKAGKLDQKALAAAEALGPTFVDALKKARSQGVSTLADLSKMIQSGELSRLGGVEGQAGIVGGTLLGQFKAMFMELNVMAADFGQSLLGPMKEAMRDVGDIMERLIMRVGPEMIAFGRGGVLGALVSMFEKLEDFSVMLFRKYLPGASGMMARFASWWEKVLYWYNDFVDGLRSLLPLGSAVIEAFGKPFMAIFETIGGWIRYVGESIKKNQAAYNSFGNTLLNFIRKIQDVGKQFIDNFSAALPFLDQFVGYLGTAVDLVMSLVGAFAMVFNVVGEGISMFGGNGQGFGSFLSMVPFLLMFGPGGKRRRGRVPGMVGGMINNLMATGMLMPMRTGRGGGAGGQGAAGQAANPGFVQRVRNARQARQQAQAGMIFAGGQDAAQMGMFRRMRNAYGGAGKGGAGLFGRLGAANVAGTRAMRAKPGAGMGTGMALMLGAMFAAPEAQGSLMAGGALASLAPVLGKAGPYAALAGVALGGLGAASKAQTAGGGAGMGALGGAAAGAAIGSLIPVIGTAFGAVLGAAAGAVYGYFKGKSNGEKKKAREAASDYMNNVYGDLSQDLFTADIGGMRARLRRMREDVDRISGIAAMGEGRGRGERARIFGEQLATGAITQDEYDALVAAPGTYRRELEKAADTTEKVIVPMMDRFENTASVVEKSLGITEDALVKLANEAGVNLFDDTVKLTDTLKALGLAAQYTSEQIIGAIRDIQVKGIEGLQQRVQQMTSGQVMDEMTEALRQQILAGGVPLQDLAGYVGDILNQFNIRNPNSPLANVQTLLDYFGPGGRAFAPGMQLEGMESAFAAIQPLLTRMAQTTQTQSTESLTDMIMRQALFSGIGLDRGEVMGRLGEMSLRELDFVTRALAEGTLFEENLNVDWGGEVGSRERERRRQAAFGRIGLGDLTRTDIELSAMTMEQKIAAFGEEGVAIMEGMNKVIEAAFTSKPDWMKNAPDWYSKESFLDLIDSDKNGQIDRDTSTPRGDTTSRRLSRTLSRHNYFNSMFAGKRNITSAYRTDMLGSINSDHITGRAYDLTGQNLGAYATMVNRMGGFAEFHGTGGARHLHVVPGETPMGDTTAPSMRTGAMSVAGGSTSNTYNVVVNAAPGMDVNTLANAVIERIQRVERQNAERS